MLLTLFKQCYCNNYIINLQITLLTSGYKPFLTFEKDIVRRSSIILKLSVRQNNMTESRPETSDSEWIFAWTPGWRQSIGISPPGYQESTFHYETCASGARISVFFLATVNGGGGGLFITRYLCLDSKGFKMKCSDVFGGICCCLWADYVCKSRTQHPNGLAECDLGGKSNSISTIFP